MHEAAITESMVRLVLDQAREHDAQVVRKVTVVLGAMSGVVAESMRFYFAEFTRGTIAGDAVLEVRAVPTKANCLSCGHGFELEDSLWLCPECGDRRLDIVEGKELMVDSIEVD
ncbi:MAG: hydrogenase maturation nickel metallochaperone HypA [Pseudomonadota bacterium]